MVPYRNDLKDTGIKKGKETQQITKAAESWTVHSSETQKGKKSSI